MSQFKPKRTSQEPTGAKHHIPIDGFELGFWNGLPTSVRRVTGRVREWREGDPPVAWWRGDVGQELDAVEIILDGVNFGGGTIFLADDDGSGWAKVSSGGSPRMGHREVPLVDVQPRKV